MVRITVHERKSEAFDYSRASTPVAKAYELLDDYLCDDAGALRKDAVEKVLLTFRNDRGFYDRSKLKAIKSYSLAWEALLREIQATLEWDDEFPHATKLSSEQVKKWFSSKGRDFKEDLKPLVDAIDKQRKTWDDERASNKAESIYGRPDSKADELAGKYYVGIEDDWDGSIYISEQDFDDYDSAEEWATSELENKADDTRVYKAVIYKMYVDDDTHQVASDVEGEILKSDVCESKKSEAYKDIWRGAKVVSYENAADYIDLPAEEEQEIIDEYGEDYYDNPDAMDEYSEALDDYIAAMFDQDFVYIDGDEIPLAVCREPKILIVQTIDHKDGDKAVELVKKLAKGELKGTSDDGDFVAIMDGVNGNPHFDIYSE